VAVFTIRRPSIEIPAKSGGGVAFYRDALLVQVGNQHQRAAQLGTLISNFLVEATPPKVIPEAAHGPRDWRP